LKDALIFCLIFVGCVATASAEDVPAKGRAPICFYNVMTEPVVVVRSEDFDFLGYLTEAGKFVEERGNETFPVVPTTVVAAEEVLRIEPSEAACGDFVVEWSSLDAAKPAYSIIDASGYLVRAVNDWSRDLQPVLGQNWMLVGGAEQYVQEIALDAGNGVQIVRGRSLTTQRGAVVYEIVPVCQTSGPCLMSVMPSLRAEVPIAVIRAEEQFLAR
jgi:hypothetical protein